MTANTRRAKSPDKEWLADRISEGLSDQQMADRWLEQTGQRVGRTAINRVVRQHDLRPRLPRYDDVIPWQVRPEHAGHWYHKMLYQEGKVRRGETLTPQWTRWLNSFKTKLAEKNAVIAYLPDSPNGFYLIPREDDEVFFTTRGRPE